MADEFIIILDDVEKLAKLSDDPILKNAVYGFTIVAPDLDTATVFATDIMAHMNLGKYLGQWHVEAKLDEQEV